MTDIEVTSGDEVATVTIRNPERHNALSSDASETMADALHDVAHDESVRCVVLAGAGDAFCSGIDLASGMAAGSPAAELDGGLNAIARRLLRMQKPTVARVDGPAVGAGAAIATACDFVYAAESAVFQWGFTDVGLAPDTGATYVLPRLVGFRRAMELLITGREVGAAEAVDLGIATEAIPDEQFDAVVDDRVEMLRSRPTQAVGEAKRLLLENAHRSLEAALEAEAQAQNRAFESEDFAEGIRAFAENRDPEFVGR
jgi:2-(1,2-epoxy-1,2-dihydrophenyl)acetyl-CoA isomerase